MSDSPTEAATRPFWIQVPEKGVWLGFTKGQWPIQAFGDEDSAAYWATQDPENKAVIGPVLIPLSTPTYRGVTIPVERKLEQIP